MSKKRVCIVGAGVSGLVTIKECKHVGLNPVCYELHSDLGGIWSPDRDSETSNSPRAWETLITNTSKYMQTFSDFHPIPDIPMYMTRQAVSEYYVRYAKHFGLKEHIQLNTRVINIKKSPNHTVTGQWDVFTCPTSSFRGGDKRAGDPPTQDELDLCRKQTFDAVIVCSGYFKTPMYPDVPGLETFPGSLTHSFDYISADPYVNKKVVVVGNSFSAGDIATDISIRTNKAVDLSVGRGTWIQPRVMAGGLSMDRAVSRKRLFTDGLVRNNNITIDLCQNRMNHIGSGVNPPVPPSNSAYIVGDDIYLKIFTDQIRIQDQLVALEGSHAKFKDGSVSQDVDAVICATGYKMNTSFLDLNITRSDGAIELYNMMLPIHEKHHTLAFVGLISGDGILPAVFELQARYVARIITGGQKPPSKDAMMKNFKYLTDMSLSRRGKVGCDLRIFELADGIAKDMGVYPDYWRVFWRDPLLAHRIWHGPLFTAQYRLLGPDSDWDNARNTCYRAHEVMYKVPCGRGPVAVIREDIITLRRKYIKWLSVVTGFASLCTLWVFVIRSKGYRI